MKFPNLQKIFNAIFGEGNNQLTIDEKAGTVTMSTEQFAETEKLAGEVSSLRSENAELRTKMDGISRDGDAIRSALGVAADANLEAINTRINELKSLPGSTGTQSEKKEETTVVDEKAKEMQAVIDAMPHNKAADEMTVN